jgi:hypothetical protein
MITSREIQSPPPGMPAEWAQWIWNHLMTHYRDIVTLGLNETASVRTLDASESILDTDFTLLLDGGSTAVVATLPDPSVVTGKIYVAKCTDATNSCSIDPGAFEIDGSSADIVLALNKSRIIQSDGTAWQILGGVL